MKKNNPIKNVIKLVVGLVIMIASGVAGILSGTFDDVHDITSMIHVDAPTILKVIVMIAFFVALNAVVQLLLHAIHGKKNRTNTLITVLSSLLKYVFVLAGLCWGLSLLGVNVGTIFAGIGIFALILGFGAENLVSDLVTGAFILFENQYNVGDIVELDGYRGTVDFIGIRTTGIRDAGGNVKIINNSDIKNIINRSERGSVAVSIIGISYALKLDEVEAKIPSILSKIKERNADIFCGEVNYLGVEELADSAVVLKFVAEVHESNIFRGRRILNRELKVLFDEEGIEIAYPQLDVHMK